MACAPPLGHFIDRCEPSTAANASGNCHSSPNFPIRCRISSSNVEKCLLTVSPHSVFVMTVQVWKTIVQTVALARSDISPIV